MKIVIITVLTALFMTSGCDFSLFLQTENAKLIINDSDNDDFDNGTLSYIHELIPVDSSLEGILVLPGANFADIKEYTDRGAELGMPVFVCGECPEHMAESVVCEGGTPQTGGVVELSAAASLSCKGEGADVVLHDPCSENRPPTGMVFAHPSKECSLRGEELAAYALTEGYAGVSVPLLR
ncbi:hypothetical protein [Limisalsivibrio acetivorans]|uniref:hypothetical protein n=1 Tax=Limisalsivibrio acetivorans TaxID=1304888 RepID=UPI0003B59075|nr:hypothetical protein [Limisalsivibrio acetivorans]